MLSDPEETNHSVVISPLRVFKKDPEEALTKVSHKITGVFQRPFQSPPNLRNSGRLTLA